MIRPIKVETLPSYEVWLLHDNSIVICKAIENYQEDDLELTAGLFYALMLVLARKLQAKGILVFIEKVRGERQ